MGVFRDQFAPIGLGAFLDNRLIGTLAGQITGEAAYDGDKLSQSLEIYSPRVVVWDVDSVFGNPPS